MLKEQELRIIFIFFAQLVLAVVGKWYATNTIARIFLALGAPIINVPTLAYSEVDKTTAIMVAEDIAEYGE